MSLSQRIQNSFAAQNPGNVSTGDHKQSNQASSLAGSPSAWANFQGNANRHTEPNYTTQLANAATSPPTPTADAGPPVPGRPPAAAVAQLRDQLLRFYAKHNPSKMDDIDTIMESFEGQERVLINALKDKYGNSDGLLFLPQEYEPFQQTAASQQEEQMKYTPPPQQQAQRAYPDPRQDVGRTPSSSTIQTRQRRRTTSLYEDLNPQLGEVFRDLHESLKEILSFNPLIRVRDDDQGPLPFIGDDDFEFVLLSEFVAAVTEFQHSAEGFVAHAKHIVDYSRQREELDTQRRRPGAGASGSPTTSPRPEGDTRNSHGVPQVRAPSPVRYMVSARDTHYHRFQRDDEKEVQATGGMEELSRGRLLSNTRSERVVIDVVPMIDERNVIANIVATKAKAGDVLVLHPGVYRENIVCGEGVDLEFRPSTGREDSTVTIVPADPSVPIFQLDADATVRISGLSLSEPSRTAKEIEEWSREQRKNQKKKAQTNPHGPPPAAVPTGPSNTMDVPLISVSQAARCDVRATSLIGGTGGVLVFGSGTMSMTQCTFRKSAFAGIYCKDTAFVSTANCHFISCEVALRVRDATFAMQHCDVRSCGSDGVALHGNCKGVVERCTITDCNDNGIILSPSCEVLLSASVVERCAMWGVYAPNGADFAMISMGFGANGMGDTSRPPPTHSAATRFGAGSD